MLQFNYQSAHADCTAYVNLHMLQFNHQSAHADYKAHINLQILQFNHQSTALATGLGVKGEGANTPTLVVQYQGTASHDQIWVHSQKNATLTRSHGRSTYII
jgi:hypothetical protein